MEVSKLINEITPLYNHYKKNKDNLTGTETLLLFWDIGDILKSFIILNNIAPHKLYRLVYGKSEGKDNIIQKSYITRDFQNKCFRIRKIFNDKDDIIKYLPKLKYFGTFYKSIPFFDNPKYKFEGKDKESLLKLLNSNKSYTKIMAVLLQLKKERIGISNPRTQRLVELENEKYIFINTYNLIYNYFKIKDYKRTIDELKMNNNIDFLKILSKNTSTLSSEGLKKYEIELPDDIHPTLSDYFLMTEKLLKNIDEKERRRFRRLIPPERIIRLSDMMFALTDEKSYLSFR